MCQADYYNLTTEKCIRKFIFLKYSLFWRRIHYINLRNPLETPHLNEIFLGYFTLSNSVILVEDLIRWNKGFEIFLIDRYDGEIENINIAGKY